MLNKEELIQKFQHEIDILHTKLDELKVQAQLGQNELKQAINPEINKIESQISAAKKRFKQLTNVSDDALGDIKQGLTMALESIAESIKSAAGRFKT
jgi:ribosome-associated translation inhibitor RaiA